MANTTFYPNIQETVYDVAVNPLESDIDTLLTRIPQRLYEAVPDRYRGLLVGTNKVALDNDIPFVLAGTVADTYGTWVQILDSLDTPIVTGKTHFTISKILPTNVTASTLFKVQIAWGAASGQAAALTAGNYIEFNYISGAAAGDRAPIDIFSPLIPAGVDAWARVRSTAETAVTFDFLYAIREF